MDLEKVEKLKSMANEWSLEKDNELCKILEELHCSMKSNMECIKNELNQSKKSVSCVSVRLANLNNRLTSLSSNQFIENRVLDDDYVDDTWISKHKEKDETIKVPENEKHEEMVKIIHEAVVAGIDLINKRFKKIEMKPEDFDEDDDPTFLPDAVFEPYDPHLNRPLPFIIGSDEWKKSPTAGLKDMPASTKSEDDVVVIGLPTFVQPRLNDAICETFASSTTEDITRDKTNKADTNVSRSVSSLQSDPSGLFLNGSPDRHSVISDDLSFKESEETKIIGDKKNENVQEIANSKLKNSLERINDPPHSLISSNMFTSNPKQNSLMNEVISAVKNRSSQAKKVHHTTKNIFTDSDSAESDSDSDLFITKPVKDQNIPKVKSIFEGEHTTSGIPYTVGPLPTKEKQESKYQLPYNDSKEEDNGPNIPNDILCENSSKIRGPDAEVQCQQVLEARIHSVQSKVSQDFAHKLSNIIAATKSPSPLSSKKFLHESEPVPETIPSIVKTRSKGPARRAPTRSIFGSNENPFDTVKNSNILSSPTQQAASIQETIEERTSIVGDKNTNSEESISSKNKDEDLHKRDSFFASQKQISLFSSDSDDDIFASTSKKSYGDDKIPKIKEASNRELNFEKPVSMTTSASQGKKKEKKSLFSSDEDEDLDDDNVSPIKSQHSDYLSINGTIANRDNKVPVSKSTFSDVIAVTKDQKISAIKNNDRVMKASNIFDDNDSDLDLFK
ncbi:unnamed protein product [Dracunculus medinensis]|uniref:CAP-ZIP_m domain-containing protein n=1 Tax=Dracunculus medinensis TaxID=318479 RepID=A0A0N4U893_DRAME|nr:unnamed protein product [Dracunculus medinensis]